MSVYSTPTELQKIVDVLRNYLRLPFSGDTIPGNIMENVTAYVRDGEVLNTYDFVDVVKTSSKVGWQVKSTKEDTPVTWKRAKIPNSSNLIKASQNSSSGLQALGDAIIDFCNLHAQESLNIYGLDEIGYARLVVKKSGRVLFFEKSLITKTKPDIFNKGDFTWQWSTPKKTKKKEQLPALHGTHTPTGKKWWAWHGLGENQLHFSGEAAWWPQTSEPHCIEFDLPTDSEKLDLKQFLDLIS